MISNWHLIYSTHTLPQASIVKGMLEENGVPVMIVNKQSSSYLSFGEIEVHVPADFKEIATRLLDDTLSS